MPAENEDTLSLGLPEWDDRQQVWRVALVSDDNPSYPVGEIQVNATGAIHRAPAPAIVAERLHQLGKSHQPRRHGGKSRIAFPPIPNKAILGRLPQRTAGVPARECAVDIYLAAIFSMPSRNARNMLITHHIWNFSTRCLQPVIVCSPRAVS